jgi:hypothetical protein
MNESQKARELANVIEGIIDEKYKRYAETIAGRLDEEFSPLSLSAVGPPATRWKEFKSQLRQKPWSYPRRITEQFVKKYCSELLRELPDDERSVLSLADSAYSAKPNPFVLELYDRVQELARIEADREAWFATTPNEVKGPVSVTSDEIVIPLADFLVTSDDLVRDINRNLEKRMVYNSLPEGRDHEETEKALRELLDNHSDFILPEDIEDAMGLPRNERGECLFDRLITNTSTGWRDQDMFYWSR